ncbi:MAG: sigma-70 family RNA polymerase sigma factor [Candidatus Binatia bacterium]
MAGAPEDWIAVLDCLVAGDRLAFAKVNRLISGFLVQLRAFDFRDEWDDLRQEVVMSLVANARAGRLRDPEAFLGYARIITRNKVVDRLKGARRRHERATVPWDEESARTAGAVEDPGLAAARELWTAVRDLPDEQQDVLDGVYRQGKTYQVVSDETGIPLGTMKRRLRDALMALRRRFADDPETSR